jgi:arylsulfatase A-like enzyme
MKKITPIITCLGAALIFILGCGAGGDKGTTGSASESPNVIIILSDDQGWGDLSMNGNTSISTPNIDNLAASGVTFDRFYVCAVCSPTRAEMLTGRYHVRGGVYSTSRGGERLDLDETTIAEVFKTAGYATAAYGKWHNGMQPPYHPNARGFDDYYGFCSGHWGNYFDPLLEDNGELTKGNGFLIDDLTDRGIDFIEKNKDNPFFLYLPYNTPHSPWQVPDRWWDKFEDKEVQQHGTAADREKPQETKAALAMCENIDWNVGRILAKLDELKLSENTIVIYFADNGPNGHRWNDGMKGTKGSTDEGGVRSPLCIKWEGTLDAGKKIKEIAGAIDLLPTLADLAGIDFEPEKLLDGISLKPLLSGDDPSWEDRFIINHWRRTSIRSQDYRLDYNGQLFDMVNDPGQTMDISSEKPEIMNQLSTALVQWKDEVLSELPETDTRTFPIGHPDYQFTQIPARDGIAHGNIERSDNSPNCTFFSNWTSTADQITWEAEVLEDGDFEVEVYYTCPPEDIGATIELSFNQENITATISTAHDPPLRGMENDRILRTQSYVKDFIPLNMGTIHLTRGKGELILKATDIPGSQVMDFRLMMFKRLNR